MYYYIIFNFYINYYNETLSCKFDKCFVFTSVGLVCCHYSHIFIPKLDRYFVSRSIKQIKYVGVDTWMPFDISVHIFNILWPFKTGQGKFYLSILVRCLINIRKIRVLKWSFLHCPKCSGIVHSTCNIML